MRFIRPAKHAVRGEAAAAFRAARRAWEKPGRERDLVFQSVKAAVAAVLAWVAGTLFLPDSLALMAPWVALVLVQATVYRSVFRGLQQLVAIAVGTVLATAALRFLGDPVAAMAVVLPITMLMSNSPRFGEQGIYGGTSALFTLSAGEANPSEAGVRLVAALLGAAIGIAVNALLRPPVYLRSTHRSVDSVLQEAEEILSDIADGLSDPWEYDRLSGWHERARMLPRLIRGVRSSIEWSRESTRLHPERGRREQMARLVPSYEETLHTLDHVADHIQGLTHTLVETAADSDTTPRPDREITDQYADFLRHIAATLAAYGEVVADGERHADEGDLHRAVGQVCERHDELRTRLPQEADGSPEAMALFGSLLTEARRLTERLIPEGAEGLGRGA